MQDRLQDIRDRYNFITNNPDMVNNRVVYPTMRKITDDVGFLLDALEQLQDGERVLRDAVNSLIGLCENVGDFSNGNTYNEIDEGNVMAERFIDHIKSNIKALEDKPNDQLKQTNENIQQ